MYMYFFYIKYTCPYTSHQNGTIEMKHRHIVEMGVKYSISFIYTSRDHSFGTYVHKINRLPTVGLSKFHFYFHFLYHKLSICEFIKVFNYDFFPFKRHYNKNKLEHMSQECVYLVVYSNHKVFKCLNKFDKVFISKKVVLNEHNFPFPNLFPKLLSHDTHNISAIIHGVTKTIPQIMQNSL